MHIHLVIGGLLVPTDRVTADRPFDSGKHRRHGMNLQVIVSPMVRSGGCPARCQERFTT